jgi:pimeloyl-ACP methyl ester carboxylesterase
MTGRWRVLALAALFPLCACAQDGAASASVGQIDAAERVVVDGAELYVLARGADRSAPVLVWLHGGPGGAERPLFRYFNGELEDHFVVAYLDQRGAGRSFDPDADPRRLTVARHLADLDVVVDHLRRSLGRETVALVGHSWGGALALLYARDHPEKVTGVVGVSPLVDTRAAQQAQYDFVRAEAARREDEDALAQLGEIDPPPHETAAEVLAMERLADRYGAVFHRQPRRVWIVLRAIASGLVTPWEISRFIRGNRVSLEAMNDELLDLDLSRSAPALDVPVVFVLGRHDRHVSAEVAAAYFDDLRAPGKRLVWFEGSAHNPPFEEPDLFNATVAKELRSWARTTMRRGPQAPRSGARSEAKPSVAVGAAMPRRTRSD